MVLCMAFLPDAWLWQLGVCEWMLPLKILWWLPTALLLLAELGLQLGMYHKASVRGLFTMILFFCVSQGLIYRVGLRDAILDGIGSYVHRDAVSSLWFHAWLEKNGGEAGHLFVSRLTALFRWLSDFAFQ